MKIPSFVALTCRQVTVHGGDHFDDAGYRQARVWQSSFIAHELCARAALEAG